MGLPGVKRDTCPFYLVHFLKAIAGRSQCLCVDLFRPWGIILLARRGQSKMMKESQALIHFYWGVIGFIEQFPLARVVPWSCRVLSAEHHSLPGVSVVSLFFYCREHTAGSVVRSPGENTSFRQLHCSVTHTWLCACLCSVHCASLYQLKC